MQFGALFQRWALWSARVFPQRDIIVRSNDKVRQLRIMPWHQKAAAAAGSVAVAWLLLSNLGLLVQSYRVATRSAEIEQRQLAYLDLMEEVTAYQRQFSRIAEGLYNEQTQLLDQIGPDLGVVQDRTADGPGFAGISEAEGQVALARETLRERLNGFEGDLRHVADQSESLRARVGALRAALTETRQERQAVADARLELGSRLEETQGLLSAERTRVQGLGDTVARLESELARSGREQDALLEARAELQSQIGGLEERVQGLSRDREGLADLVAERDDELRLVRHRIAALSDERDRLAGDLERERGARMAGLAGIAALEAQLHQLQTTNDRVASRNRTLDDEVARLQGHLAQRDSALQVAALRERDLTRALAMTAVRLDHRRASLLTSQEQGKSLGEQVVSLKEKILQMGADQEDLVARYRGLTRDTIETFEKTVAMTGLDVQDLMASLDERFVPRGGPFVSEALDPHDDWSLLPYLDADGQPVSTGAAWLEASMSNLDLQLDRWEGLQDLLRAMPLAPPLEEYEITSSYGFRYDPVNGRKAKHEGTDFAGPAKTSVYSTAAGRVAYAGWKGHYGRVVDIDHGHGIRTRYAHLRSIMVKRGDQVGNRQKIGLLGSSGRTTGPHLHYEVLYDGKAIDPQKFLLAGKYVFKE